VLGDIKRAGRLGLYVVVCWDEIPTLLMLSSVMERAVGVGAQLWMLAALLGSNEKSCSC